MLDVKWEIDEEDGRGWRHTTGDTLFDHIDVAPNTYKYERLLKSHLLSTQLSNGELYELTLRNGYLPCHTNEILVKLQNDGKLLVERYDGKLARKSSFYINYKSYKSEPQKIKVKIKQNG